MVTNVHCRPSCLTLSHITLFELYICVANLLCKRKCKFLNKCVISDNLLRFTCQPLANGDSCSETASLGLMACAVVIDKINVVFSIFIDFFLCLVILLHIHEYIVVLLYFLSNVDRFK